MEPITPEEIVLTQTLPKKYPATTLQGKIVRLEPYDPDRDIPVIYERTNGSSYTLGSKLIEPYDCEQLIWRFLFYGPFTSPEDLRSEISKHADMPNCTFFTIFDQSTNSQIGLISMMNNFPEFLKVEIGHVIFCTGAQRTGANYEASLLLLNHSFSLGYRRLEWKCDNLNERSKKAALSIGFEFEGVQRWHMIIKGKNRDTAWFRILAREWNMKREKLEAKLNSYS